MNETYLSGRDFAMALGVVVIWGSNFVVTKLVLQDFTPFQLGAARYAVAALPLVILIKPPKLRWKWVILYGLLQGVGQFGLLFIALYVGMTAALASVLMQTQVFFTALFGFVLLNEKITQPVLGGLLLAALGLACFVMNYIAPPITTKATYSVLGFTLTLIAAAMWAASNIAVRYIQRLSPSLDVVAFTVWSSLVPIVPFIVLALAFDPPITRWKWIAAPWRSWLAIAYLGWIATTCVYAMWTNLLKRHAANRVAPLSLGVPIVGLATGMLVLGESITAWQWTGIALMMAALVCVLLGGRLRQKVAPTFIGTK